MQTVVAAVLAAGQGTRMKSDLLKVLHPVAGKPMVGHVVEAAQAAGMQDVIVVVGYQGDRVRAALGDRVRYAEQAEQLGTGHAVMQAAPLLQGVEGHLLILYGDNTLLRPETIKGLMERHVSAGAAATTLTAVMLDPRGLGRIIRDGRGRYLRTVEEKDATPEQKAINEVMSGIFCFRLPLLFDLLARLRADNVQKEYYLTDVLGLLVQDGQTVEVEVASDWRDVIGPNNRRQLAAAEAIMRERILDRLMDDGVSVIDPASTFVHAGVRVGRDTILAPFTFLEGDTVVGEGCRIGPSSRIVDSRIGNGAAVTESIIEKSAVGDGARVGPFSHLRPGSDIGPQVEVGNFAETKGATLGPRTKAHHHCYLGDVVIGEGANIGAGVVTVNYNGVEKHRTVIGDRAFIGCNVNMLAPLTVGDGAYVAAGSTVDQDVPADALAVARTRQVNKEGYVPRLRARYEARQTARLSNEGEESKP